MTRILSFSLIFSLLSLHISAQKVGIVLSGGGAKAAAHVGFLKALEENQVPIDYIAGASMGAIIGAMYASGYSVAEIDSILRSDDYLRMARGEVDAELKYFFKEYPEDAAVGTLKFSSGNLISPVLPTNLVSTALLDFNFMQGYAQASAAADYNFDSLMVPFRCIASDVANKEQVIFRNGHLSTAVRASMTYPFFVEPIRVDGVLLFDGGLYNNFPSDIVYEDFLPEVIIGNNVSSNAEAPKEDDPISQLRSMVVYETNFESLCDEMLVVEPLMEVGTFDFEDISMAIQQGYEEAMRRMPEILALVERRVNEEEIEERRRNFRKKFAPLIFDEISISGIDRSQKNYIKRFIGRRNETLSIGNVQRQYFRVYADDKIKSIFPSAVLKKSTGYYALNLDMKKEKDIVLSVGGNFSSRPLNVGYVNLRYNLFGRISTTLNANSYFGKFYGSAHASARFDFSSELPFSVEPQFTLNRWDYFRSFATFFEEVRPSFIVINETFAGLRLRMPVGNKGRVDVLANYAQILDDYYQTQNFQAADTADRTRFSAGVLDVIYERNTLNRKLYAHEGSALKLQGKMTSGLEQTIPGSTSINRDTTSVDRQWVMAKLCYENYFGQIGPLKIGMLLEGVVSNQPLFQNVIASQISAQRFQPIPESKSFFLPQFRAYNYAAGGLKFITTFTQNLHLRLEGYTFVANGSITADSNGAPGYERKISPYHIGSANLVFHSPIGPLSLALNYYDQKERPWSFVFNFGYLIFNRSVRHD